jgi:hypothetical protein
VNKPRPLPRSVQEVADVIGREAALALVDSLPRAFGRPWQAFVYIPKAIRPDHPLVLLLGWNTADKLVRVFGGEMLRLASCSWSRKGERDIAIRAMRASGAAVQAVAREFQISERQVRNICAEIPHVEANDNFTMIAEAS